MSDAGTSGEVAAPFAGPWPDGRPLLRDELQRYVSAVIGGSIDDRATRCAPWTVRDVTIHLAETFRRFGRMLDQGRRGDFTPPFTPDELDEENLRAVVAFAGDPVAVLAAATTTFVDAVDDLDEPMPHQMGTLPAGLQVLFGLMDIALHHDDVQAAVGASYRPPPETIDALVVVAQRLFGAPADLDDPWPMLVAGSGRLPT